MIGTRMSGLIQGYITEVEEVLATRTATATLKKAQMKERHCAARQELKEQQALRWAEETKERAGRFRGGVRGIWDWITGRSKQIRKQNEQEAWDAMKRDDREREDQVATQLAERRELQKTLRELRRVHSEEIGRLRADVAHYLGMAGRQAEPVPDQDIALERTAGRHTDRDRDLEIGI